MRFYVNDAGQWFTSQAEAKASLGIGGQRYSAVEIDPTKSGLLAWLNGQTITLGRAEPPHDNLAGVPPVERNAAELAARGIDDPSLPPAESVAAAQVPVPSAAEGTYAARSVELDQAFAAAPLGQQLTLAAIALENAHRQLGKSR